MKHIFYALIILQALYELAKLFRCKYLYQHVKVFQKLDKTSKRWYLMAHPWLHVAFFMDIAGLLLLGVGLFSSQWIYFLVVLAMSFSQIQKLGKHSKKCTFYTLRFGCSFAAVNTIKPQLL